MAYNNIEEFISEYGNADEPLKKYEVLVKGEAELGHEPEYILRKKWFNARYKFMDKKQSLVRDNFIWLLLIFSSYKLNTIGAKKELLKCYKDVFSSKELEAALEYKDILKEEIYDAAYFFASTYRNPKAFLGIVPPKNETAAEQKARVAGMLTKQLLHPVYKLLSSSDYGPLLLQTLYNSACDYYSGIETEIQLQIDALKDTEDIPGIKSILRL